MPRAPRFDVYAGRWEGGPAAAGQPRRWATWWVIDGGDGTHPLRAIDASASLDDQVQAVELALDIIVPGHGVACFRSHLTRDGKRVAVMSRSIARKTESVQLPVDRCLISS